MHPRVPGFAISEKLFVKIYNIVDLLSNQDMPHLVVQIALFFCAVLFVFGDFVGRRMHSTNTSYQESAINSKSFP